MIMAYVFADHPVDTYEKKLEYGNIGDAGFEMSPQN
jgi:hypothetical protein